MPDLVKAAVLSIVEGLTEFIPVSSTGHLILVGDLLAFSGPLASTFEIFIQLGAILAVVVLYFRRFQDLLLFSETKGFKGTSAIAKLGVACLPAFALGFMYHDIIKAKLFSPLPVAIALIVGGIVLLFIEKHAPKSTVDSLDELSISQALWVGVFQCASLWPGVSRSGATIVGGLSVGLNKRVAAEFSFLVAVPVMFAATGYDLLKAARLLSLSDFPTFALGFALSFFSALVAIKFFIKILERASLRAFGLYRILLGLIVLGLI